MDSLPNNLTPLCFNRQELTRRDFNPERFLTQTRQHVSLEQIKTDLHLYLKILQNAMIELINKDYADFVNLSSNLVNLRATVQKLQTNTCIVDTEFQAQTESITKVTNDMENLVTKRRTLAENERCAQRKLSLLVALQKLGMLLGQQVDVSRITALLANIHMLLAAIGSTCKVEYEPTFHRLVDKFQANLDTLFVQSVQRGEVSKLEQYIDAYGACNRLDAAQAVLVAEFFERPLQACLLDAHGSKLAQLQQVLAKLLSLARDHSSLFSFRPLFIAESASTALLACLQAKFVDLTFPSDPDAFFAARQAVLGFAHDLDAILDANVQSTAIFKAVLGQFNLPVYFHLRAQALRSTFDAACSNAAETTVPNALFECLANIWSKEVYIPQLADRFFEFTCQLLNRFLGWLNKFGHREKHIANGLAAVSNGNADECSLETIIPLIAECGNVGPKLDTFFHSILFPVLQESGISNLSPIKDCLSCVTLRLQQALVVVREALVRQISAEMVQKLAAVNEIPRQYRWTRKDAPSTASVYVREAFRPLNELFNAATTSHFDVTPLLVQILPHVLEAFQENVRGVLVSVDKMATSLNRLKKGAAKGSAGEGAQSDDDKIRMQLQLDVKEFQRLVSDVGFSDGKLLEYSELNKLLSV